MYYAHPYASCEREQNERHNRLLRRYIPKGTPVDNYSAEDILFAADCINLLPRKMFNYDTPESLFNNELDLIYAM